MSGERPRWVDAPMADPWHRDTVGGLIAQHSTNLTEWAERIAEVYGRSGTLEVTAVVLALLAERDEARASARTAWDVHAEHVEQMNVLILQAQAVRDEARRERDDLAAKVAAVRELHKPSSALFMDGRCDVDDEPLPCATRRAVGEPT